MFFCYQCSFIFQTVSQFFEILIFSQDICGNVHYVPEIIFISSGTLIKAFHLPNKTIQKKSERRFCRRKRAEDNNAKINIFPKIPCTFLLFKVRAFLQIFFPINLLFRKVLRTSVFLNSKSLKTSNKRTHIPLSINQFVSLIELKM